MAPSIEAKINTKLHEFWTEVRGRPVRAPTLLELWHEQERVAELDHTPLPTWTEVLEHFAWFFGVEA